MLKMKSILVVVFLLFASVSLSTACSCFPNRGPESYCRYDLIFRGQAVAEYEERKQPIDFSDPNWEYDPYRDWVYTMRVDSIVQAPENLTAVKEVRIRTPVQGSLCGTRLPLDVDGVFFAYVNVDGDITTSLCAPNTPWEGISKFDQQYFSEGLAKDCERLSQGTTTLSPEEK